MDKDLEHRPAEAVSRRITEVRKAGIRFERLPDVIAAGSVLMTPGIPPQGGARPLVQPFITPDSKLSFTGGQKALGIAVVHLIWAIEDILLGEIPWTDLLHRQITMASGEYIVLETP